MQRETWINMAVILLLIVCIIVGAIVIQKLTMLGDRDRSSDRYNRYVMRELVHAQIAANLANLEHNIPQLRLQLARVRALKSDLPTAAIQPVGKGIPQPPPPASRLPRDTVRPAHPAPSRRG